MNILCIYILKIISKIYYSELNSIHIIHNVFWNKLIRIGPKILS